MDEAEGTVMRSFDYTGLPDVLMSPDITNMASAIHEFKGR
jgi:hypothetical protein